MRNILSCLAVFVACVGARAEENAALDEQIKQLKNSDSDVRREAAKKIGEFGKDGKKATAALAAAMRTDKDLFVKRFAAQSIGMIDADPKVAVPALTTLLDQERELVDAAVVALGKMGPAAVPALVEAMKKKGGNDKTKGNKKGPQTTDRTAALRSKAAVALGQLGADAKSAVPALIAALNDATIQMDVVNALGAIGPAAKQAVPALRESVNAKGAKKNKELSKAVNQAIAKIEKN